MLQARLCSKRVCPAIVMILQEINDICRNLNMEYRLADADTQVNVNKNVT